MTSAIPPTRATGTESSAVRSTGTGTGPNANANPSGVMAARQRSEVIYTAVMTSEEKKRFRAGMFTSEATTSGNRRTAEQRTAAQTTRTNHLPASSLAAAAPGRRQPTDAQQRQNQTLAALIQRDFGISVRVLAHRSEARVSDEAQVWMDNRRGGISGRTAEGGKFHANSYQEACAKLTEKSRLRELRETFEHGLLELTGRVQQHWQGRLTVSAQQPPRDCPYATVWPLATGEVGLQLPGERPVALRNMAEVEHVLKSRAIFPAAPSFYDPAAFRDAVQRRWNGRVKAVMPAHGVLHRHATVGFLPDGTLVAGVPFHRSKVVTIHEVDQYFIDHGIHPAPDSPELQPKKESLLRRAAHQLHRLANERP